MSQMPSHSTTEDRVSKYVLILLRLSVAAVFFGRAWQHLFWDAPFRTILWDEELLTGAVEFFTTMTWSEYATSGEVDTIIQFLIRGTGVLYLLCAAAALRVKASHAFERFVLAIGSVGLTILALLYYKQKFYQLGQFLEYACQFGAPMLLLWATRKPSAIYSKHFSIALRVAVALTFACHGLYAVGYYPVPGEFVDMMISILGVTDAQALKLLEIAAVLDFGVAGALVFGIALPYAFAYAAFWGVLTTLARIFANVSYANLVGDSAQWLPEAIYRLPHAFVPMVAFLIVAPHLLAGSKFSRVSAI
ncbi:MAG: hypothetical protein V4692_01715 [Bdellovibrionota bacterium]